MKKLIICCLIAVVAIASSAIFRGAVPTAELTVTANPVGKNNAVAKAHAPVADGVKVVAASNEKSENAAAVIQQAMTQAASLGELEHRYMNLKPEELEQKLSESKAALEASGLIAKSNQGPLSITETTTLLTEIRRQHVLNTLLAKMRIEEIKRKFL